MHECTQIRHVAIFTSSRCLIFWVNSTETLWFTCGFLHTQAEGLHNVVVRMVGFQVGSFTRSPWLWRSVPARYDEKTDKVHFYTYLKGARWFRCEHKPKRLHSCIVMKPSQKVLQDLPAHWTNHLAQSCISLVACNVVGQTLKTSPLSC